jgi:hypothetical protein
MSRSALSVLRVATDRNLGERLKGIEDDEERAKAIGRRYKRENFFLGAKCTSAVVNTLLLPTHGARLVQNGLQIRATANNLGIVEDTARREGVDVERGPKKRYIALGVCCQLALKAVTLGHDDVIHASECVEWAVDTMHDAVDTIHDAVDAIGDWVSS